MRSIRNLRVAPLLVMFCGCTLVTNPGSFENGGGDGGTDSGRRDSGGADSSDADGSDVGDTSSDSPDAVCMCSGSTPFCTEDTMDCVACLETTDCMGDGQRCIDNECVQCDEDSDTYPDPAIAGCLTRGVQRDCEPVELTAPGAPMCGDSNTCVIGKGVLSETLIHVPQTPIVLGDAVVDVATRYGVVGGESLAENHADLHVALFRTGDFAVFAPRAEDTEGTRTFFEVDSEGVESFVLPPGFPFGPPFEGTMARTSDDAPVFAGIRGEEPRIAVAVGGIPMDEDIAGPISVPVLDPNSSPPTVRWLAAIPMQGLPVAVVGESPWMGPNFPWMGGGPYASAADGESVYRWPGREAAPVGIVSDVPEEPIGPLANSERYTAIPTAAGMVFLDWAEEAFTLVDPVLPSGSAIAVLSVGTAGEDVFLVAYPGADGRVRVDRYVPEAPERDRFGLILDLDSPRAIAMDYQPEVGLLVGIVDARGAIVVQRVTPCDE